MVDSTNDLARVVVSPADVHKAVVVVVVVVEEEEVLVQEID